jgi:hypothetical protein
MMGDEGNRQPARRVNRPLLVVGLAGSSFFLIGGAAAAIAAIVLASIPGLAARILRPDGSKRVSAG